MKGCTLGSAELKHLELLRADAAGIHRTRDAAYARGEALAKAKLSEAPGVYFACATPAYGYTDAFELFVSVMPPTPYRRNKLSFLLLKKGESLEGIPKVKANRGRTVVFCKPLSRDNADPDRRTFILHHDAEVRTMEARMVRVTGIELSQCSTMQNPAAPCQYVHQPPMFTAEVKGPVEVAAEQEEPTTAEVWEQKSGTWVVKLHNAPRQLGRWTRRETAVARWQAATLSQKSTQPDLKAKTAVGIRLHLAPAVETTFVNGII